MKWRSFIIFSFLSIYILTTILCISFFFHRLFVFNPLGLLPAFLKSNLFCTCFFFLTLVLFQHFFDNVFEKETWFFLIPHLHKSHYIFSPTLKSFWAWTLVKVSKTSALLNMFISVIFITLASTCMRPRSMISGDIILYLKKGNKFYVKHLTSTGLGNLAIIASRITDAISILVWIDSHSTIALWCELLASYTFTQSSLRDGLASPTSIFESTIFSARWNSINFSITLLYDSFGKLVSTHRSFIDNLTFTFLYSFVNMT